MVKTLIKKKFNIFPDGTENKFIEVYFKDDNIWFSQKYMANLFNCSIDNISLHLKNIFNTNELNRKLVIEEFSITANDGKKYLIKQKNEK